jgi:hypothetical protein
MNVIETYHIFVNSSQRVSGTAGNYYFNLYHPIRLKNQMNSFYVRIGSAEIPFTYQLLISSNNVISFTYTRDVTITTISITIPSGNYNILSLIKAITDQLTPLMVAGIVWNITYNRNTGLVTFGFSPPDSITTTLSFQSISTVMSRCLGFNSIPIGSFGLSSSVLITINSTQNVNLSQVNSLYIRSENIKQLQNYESIVSKNDISDILAKIQINVLPQNYVMWYNEVDLRVKVANKFFDTINLYVTTNLTDDELLFNGLDWTCRITIEEVEEVKYNGDTNLNNLSSRSERTSFGSSEGSNLVSLEDKKQELINELLKIKQQLVGQ